MLFSYDRASELMDKAGIDIILANTETNVSYLADYYSHFMDEDFFLDDGSSQYISFVGLPKEREKQPFFTPNSQDGEDLVVEELWIRDLRFYGSYIDYSPLKKGDSKSWIVKYDNAIDCVVGALADRALENGVIGLEMTRIPVSIFLKLKEKLPKAVFVDGTEVLRQLRIIKSKEEIIRMERAAQLTDKAMQASFRSIRVGTTELEVERLLKKVVAESGGDFAWCHVAFGPRSISLPTDRKIKAGETARIDFGGSYKGYICDTCRTKILDKANKEQIKMHNAVLNTLRTVKKEIAPGIKCSDLYNTGKNEIEKYGCKLYSPTVGHGVGKDIHEIPFLTGANSTALEPGMVLAIEIYTIKEDWTIAINLEDQILVTDNGYKDFNFVNLDL